MLVAPSTIDTARDASTVPRSHQPGPLPFGKTVLNALVKPVRSAHRRSSTAPA